MSFLITGVEMVRSYTPLAAALDKKLLPPGWTEDCLCLMVKQYPEGLMSRYLCSLKSEDTVSVGSASGSLRLSVTGGVTRLCLLAAGSGFTPMVNVIVWALGADKEKKL
jgi:cytochrome-b5 reductase